MKQYRPFYCCLCLIFAFTLLARNWRVTVPDTPTPTPGLDPIDRSLLSDDSCSAPCWNGLRLGESTKDVVVSVIQTLPYIDLTTMKEQEGVQYWVESTPDERDPDLVPAELIGAECTGHPGLYCVVFILVEDTLMEMTLSPTGYLSFGSIVAHLGPPDYVSVDPMGIEQRGCEIGLLWIDRQVDLDGPVLDVKPSEKLCQSVREGKKLDQSLQVTGISYQMPYSYRLSHTNEGNYYPWPGFENP